MVDGTVVSKTDKYGFIRDKEGVSYYFNHRSLKSGQSLSGLAIGDTVLFTSKAGPKGMIASEVRKLETYPAYSPGERVLFSKKESPFRPHELPVTDTFTRIQTLWYRSPADAREALDRVVKQTGANAVVGVGMYRQTWNSGNYQYTMHSSYADVGVYFVAKQLESEREANIVTANNEARARSVKEALDEKQAWLNEQRKKQESTRFYKVLSIIVAFILIAFFAAFFALFLF